MLPAIGYAIRDQNREILRDPLVTAAEITFERADDPLRVERYIADMQFDHVSVHSLKMSVASPNPPADRYLEPIREIALENGAQTVSDHLGFTRDTDHGVEMGHFSAPPYTVAALDVVCRNIDHVQKYFKDLDFYLENPAYLFQFQADFSEEEFLSQVLAKTGCGWLLDVANLYANSRNYKYDPFRFISHVMPHASKLQIHLAGGFYDDKHQFYFDTHSHPVPDEVKALYRHALVLAQEKVTAVFVERDQNFPETDAEWREEIYSIRRIAEQVYFPQQRKEKGEQVYAQASL